MFQNILIPTDFSECASYARDAAGRFADKFGSTLHLAHFQDEAISSEEELTLQQQLDDEMDTLLEGFGHKTKINTYLERGKVAPGIADLVRRLKIDLICIGSFGASGFEEFFIGSQTQKVIRLVHCPSLIVKSPLDSISWKSVLFASGFDTRDRPAFDYCARFVKNTSGVNAEIHLLSVNTGSSYSNPSLVIEAAMESFRAMARPLRTSLHLYKDLTRETGIQVLSNKTGAGLVAISNIHRSTLHRMLFGSTVETVVNHTKLPVLCIDLGDLKAARA